MKKDGLYGLKGVAIIGLIRHRQRISGYAFVPRGYYKHEK